MDWLLIRRWRAGLLVALVLGLIGCTTVARHYRSALHKSHRHAEVFDFNSLRAELIWDAVLATPEMRAAWVEREAQLRHMGTTEVKRLGREMLDEPGTNFYINVFAPRDVKDLLSAKTYWRLELQDASGGIYAPRQIVEVPISQLDRKMFRFLNRWSKAYLVQFPETHSYPLALTLYGLNATSTLRWK